MEEATISLDLKDVVFAEANAEQQALAWELNGESWAAPMEIADYVKRERFLSQQPLSANGRCKYWILHLKDQPNQIIASCESTRKPVILHEDGSYRDGYGYAIASVYTNPKFRRLGMAAFMLGELQKFMDGESDLSVLYSDIGKSYYAKLGWDVFPSEQVTLFLLPAPDSTPNNITIPKYTPTQPGITRPLAYDELKALCDTDVARLKARFQALPGDGKSHVAFLPSIEQISWQLAREQFMAKAMFGKEIPNRGAITTDGRAWVYWDHDWREKKLKLMRIVTPVHAADASDADKAGYTNEQRVADIQALMEAALAEASSWNLEKVLVWNPDEYLTVGAKAVSNANADAVKVVFEERLDGSIPCLRWKANADTANTVWEENYYYCWC